ncbi:hypothetical protein UVI_02011620 [Ustilaginoidea virens]|uniref:Cation chloride cotransporter n=1 Tax=Ustilaginoidea virens TaxID=1159556 RepID=A0A1B5L316_USTVR|nr:hypothetical protein UVI_02011620 [Ustilaginoidea virens]
MPASPCDKGDIAVNGMGTTKGSKLGLVSGVYIPVCLNIMSILMFLRFGLILGQVGFLGILALLVTAYCVDLLTTLSLSAIASNGEVKGGGAYYLISRSLGPEFGGSIGTLFFLAQALNTALNIVGLLDCLQLNFGSAFAQGYWTLYGLQTAALLFCTGMCLLGSATFSKASNLLLAILTVSVVSIPVSAIFKAPFVDRISGVTFTGVNLNIFANNLFPNSDKTVYRGLATFRDLFGILFPATSGIFAGASMSGDLKNPSKAIPKGTLWAMLTTFIVYFLVALSMAFTIERDSLLANANIVSLTNLSKGIILAGECAVTLFSALMGIIGSAKLFQALARDKLLPGLSILGRGTKKSDEPMFAILLTYAIAQIGSAPNFRPSFKFFNWQTACIGSLLSASAMFFIDETYAAIAICALVLLFLLIHYLCPPKRWGDVSQNLIYHQVRKYLLRLKPEHIKFWRPHIILLINDPRRQARLIQFCNSMKKGSLYVLGHVIVTSDFDSGVHEARLQQQAWSRYISEFSRIKAFVQLTMSPSIIWGVRNLILAAGLGGMRPNMAVLGFYNMEDLRRSNPSVPVPGVPASPAAQTSRRTRTQGKTPNRRRRDTSALLLESVLPTDAIRTEGMMSPTEYMTMLEDLALKYRLNVAVAYGFDKLETPRHDETKSKKYIDLWPIQMSAEVSANGQNVLTTNFETYTLILQLGHILRSVRTWRRVYAIRVMVFVEYEHEVDEESARVKTLLEKLRIDAHVLVFCLASANLNTYELIVNGETKDDDTEIVVAEALRDEGWWEDLQGLRRQTGGLSASQELSQLAHILDAAGNVGYNPHEENGGHRRRQSMAEVMEMPRRPNIARLFKLGVNMGIHTTHINDEVLLDSSSDADTDTDTGESSDDEAYSMRHDCPLLVAGREGRGPASHGLRRPTTQADRQSSYPAQTIASAKYGRGRKPGSVDTATTRLSYGTMSASQTIAPAIPETAAASHVPGMAKTGVETPEEAGAKESSHMESFPTLNPLHCSEPTSASPGRSRSTSPPRGDGLVSRDDNATPTTRPSISRQLSAARFSSRPVPETKITAEAEGSSKISFAPCASNPPTPRAADRPAFSRQSSLGKFSSRPLPETKVSGEEGARTMSFAQRPADHSRQNSQLSTAGQDRPHGRPQHGRATAESAASPVSDAGGGGGGVALSFNDLPSRAQHLILNELMCRNSRDSAVLMTTLPIPCEGTSLDEVSTVQYLSDVEVLCKGLPPTLMVLSNNLTVTVNL